MKKIGIAVLLVALAAGLFTGVAAAAQTGPTQAGTLHQYMEEALATALNLPLATVEAEFEAGKTLGQIALDHGIAQADLSAFMLKVRTQAINAAVADGLLTQTQADRMLQARGHGMGAGYMNASTGPCGGTGIPVGSGMHRGGGGFGR